MVARIGAFCFRYRWAVLIGWLLIMVAGVAAAGPVITKVTTTRAVQGTESDDAQRVVRAEADHGLRMVTLVDGIDPSRPDVRDAVAGASADVSAIPGVQRVDQPVAAADGRAVRIGVMLDRFEQPERDAETDALNAAQDRFRALADAVPGAEVSFGGADIVPRQAGGASQNDLVRAEGLSLALTLILLVFVFRGFVAAAVPVLATIATMTGALVGLLVFSRFVDLDITVLSVVVLLGLGLSIDYGLLLVARYREELARGHDPHTAVAKAWSTAGRTVSFSGLTIVFALCGLLLFDMPRLQAMGAAGISAALLALVAALTFTAGLLGVFHKRIKPSERMRRRASEGDVERGFFARLARMSQRSPRAVVIVTTGLLLLLAAPLATVEPRLPQLAGLPTSIESVRVSHELAERFGETTFPAVRVVARTDPGTLQGWAQKWSGDAEVARVGQAEAEAPGLSSVAFDVRGDSQDEAARDLVLRMRADRPTGGESWVTGDAAILLDLLGRIYRGLPAAIAVTLGAMLVLMLLMTRSLLVPLKAVLMNVLSLGATYGVLTLIFQHGVLAGPLDTLTIGGLTPYLLVTVFAFAFGFSMDYEVFLLGRIKEYVDSGMETNVAVRRGLQRTGGIVTSAALLMMIVFGCFGAASLGDIEQIGVGLFVAILIDATIVRCLLVPATMTLLGRWNWWAPWRRTRVVAPPREQVRTAGGGIAPV
ncbi:MMPL family transporter [Micromonospora sp. DR5-3]|uniref:MMPL family transporter n=1 Tax=unclassified Micromonospora TaxID=2617518 RepID=UPI00165212C2|nr:MULTISPECIES: MMPL family transporter [unclassified Micromonospora]MCW3817569.1 MMPL family transporter [Micromonospora sp. DR5-3]